MTLAISQTIHAYNIRSEKSLFVTGPFSNKQLNWATLASLAAMALVLFTPVKIAFGLATLSAKLYLIGFGLAIVPLFVMEIAKLIEHTVQKKRLNKHKIKINNKTRYSFE